MTILLMLCTAAVILLGNQSEQPISPVHEALDSIERAGEDLHAFTADVAYRKDDALLGGGELRTGSMVYDTNPEASPRLAVNFDYRIDLGSNERRAEHKQLIFDGGWLVERDEAARQFIKRQIVRPGDMADPMRLGGPFPLPIGQKREDVLRTFTVTKLDPPPDHFAVPKSEALKLIGLHLVPREGSEESEDWASIDLWYDLDKWLPIGVIATEVNGDQRRIRLTKAKLHDVLPEASESLLSIEVPSDGWSVDVQPWVETQDP